ncbi:LYR motif-containing protein 1, partial [Tetrabaena socialis]
MTSAFRPQALALYRTLLRSSYRWPGAAEEKQYIKQEASRLFRANLHLSDPGAIAEK